MAAERHQPGDYGRLPVAHAAHHHSAVVLGGFAGLQDVLQLLKEPVSAHKHRVCGDAGDLEQQGLQHDVHGFVWSKTSCGKQTNLNYFLFPQTQESCFFRQKQFCHVKTPLAFPRKEGIWINIWIVFSFQKPEHWIWTRPFSTSTLVWMNPTLKAISM